ncbi:uncharacterized protein LOC134655576 [Cydia amplana]|uniref:uncharacterized protein LOC134655576 n=1 Tax=Cydia amplana TaxID=1869771 RepID=UPI002FE5EAA5
MLAELQSIRDRLNKLREDIVKLGPDRRRKEIGRKKLDESNELYNRAADIVSQLQEQTEKYKASELELANTHINDIADTYSRIKIALNYFDTESQTEEKMAKPSFDVKTAIALLPVMTGQEDTTKQLIDGILMYSSIINSETQQVLIEFVLKTRLSSSAKLRLKTSYTSVELLIADMRTFLLPKKSSESIQAQLYRARQGRRTIEAFGAEIEDLFVNLTISQADGNDSRYDVLRPLNEKSAIKRFADGLADPKLSTIISSRQFTSLPEAIRTAIDEHSSSPRQDQVLHYGSGHSRNNYGNRNAHSARYNRNRGRNFNAGDKLTTTNLLEHKINLKENASPVYVKPYRIPHALRKELQTQIQDMLDNDIIEETTSEWSSPVLRVPKKSDKLGEKKWRLVVDYRQLNNKIQDDKFPLPNITEILDSLAGSVCNACSGSPRQVSAQGSASSPWARQGNNSAPFSLKCMLRLPTTGKHARLGVISVRAPVKQLAAVQSATHVVVPLGTAQLISMGSPGEQLTAVRCCALLLSPYVFF